MGRAVALREDFDGPALRRLAKASKDRQKRPKALDRAGGFLRWLRFTMVAVARRRRGSVLSGSRWSVTGFSVSTPRGRMV